MSRAQDQIIDDEENETCPLCIEEFDLSDRSFWPCPCGYQICQFCYNNIKTTMNGLCPACRRSYDDKNIKWEAPSAEEVAKYKEGQAQQAKKKAAAKQKEAQRREADTLSRKHLSGIRVRRQNLVYVTGLRLNISDPNISDKLRGDQFFGQYGKIDKIVVNKPKEARSVQSIGVYITYFRKEDAALCIEMVNGSQNAGTTIRADYGTTKYCSAYLRNETCTNRNCTFLHEAGEENESFTRQDLSNMNAISTQSPAYYQSSASLPHSQQQRSHTPSHQSQNPLAHVTQSMDRQDSRDSNASPVDSSDGSALPSTASWAQRYIPSRRESQALSQHAASPLASTVMTAKPPSSEKTEAKESPPDNDPPVKTTDFVSDAPASSNQTTLESQISDPALRRLRDNITSDSFRFIFDETSVSGQELEFLKKFPPLFDANQGVKRYMQRLKEAERHRQEKDEEVAHQALSALETEEVPEGGSLQLEGEPDEPTETNQQSRHNLHSPLPDSLVANSFDLSRAFSPTSNNTASGRSLVPQQQQYLLQQFKSASPNPRGLNDGTHQTQLGLGAPASHGHVRQTSRFAFANDPSSSATTKQAANQKLMNPQASMMPPHAGQYNLHNAGGQFFTSGGVQGPPPGLKATGTPPVSGGGMFGQGHGFATAGLGYGINSTGRNANDEMMRELLRNRGNSAGSGQTSESARRLSLGPGLYADTSIDGLHTAFGVSPVQSAFIAGRRMTPTLPPGLARPINRPLFSSETAHFGSSTQHLSSDFATIPGLGGDTMGRTAQLKGEASKLSSSIATTARPSSGRVISKIISSASEQAKVPPRITDDSSFPSLPKAATRTKALDPLNNSVASVATNNHATKAHDATLVVQTPSKTVEGGTEQDVEKTMSDADRKRGRERLDKLDIPLVSREVALIELDSSSKAAPSSGKPATPVQSARDSSVTPSASSSRPATPTPSAEAAQKRTTQPRTIRVLSTPKPETLPPVTVSSATASAQAEQISTPLVRSSRQASVASPNPPGTPVSEKPSDTLSVTTDSISRANSPPLSRVGSAPTRTKTKNQLKKERQERAKQAADEKKSATNTTIEADSEVPGGLDGVVQEPIIGRKKKTKKPGEPRKTSGAGTTATSTPDQSRPSSPGIHDKPKIPPVVTEDINEKSEEEIDTTKLVSQPDQEDVKRPSDNASQDAKGNSPELTQEIVADMKTFIELELETLDSLKSWHAAKQRHDLSSKQIMNTVSMTQLTAEEMSLLDQDKPVHRCTDPERLASRVMITPSRKCLRCLSAQTEERFLELEKRFKNSKSPLRYKHKNQTDNLMSAARIVEDILKDMASALVRPPTTTIAAAAAAANTASSIEAGIVPTYADDALAYLNQFILPPLPPRTNVFENLRNGNNNNGNGGGTGLTNKAFDSGVTTPSIGSAIPRTYTTGDPTYSVSGFDVNASSTTTTQYSSSVSNSTNAPVPPSTSTAGSTTSTGPPLQPQSTPPASASTFKAAVASMLSEDEGAGSGTSIGNNSSKLGNDLATIRRALSNAMHRLDGATLENGAAADLRATAEALQIDFSTSISSQIPLIPVNSGSNDTPPAIPLPPPPPPPPPPPASSQQQQQHQHALLNSLDELEKAMHAARKETEALDKKIAALVKRNKRLVVSTGGV